MLITLIVGQLFSTDHLSIIYWPLFYRQLFENIYVLDVIFFFTNYQTIKISKWNAFVNII